MSLTKMWCLHCNITFYKDGEDCPNCGAGYFDIVYCSRGTFRRAYPELKLSDIVVGQYYPLYP